MNMKVGILGCAHMHVHSYAKCLTTLGVSLVTVYDDEIDRATEFGANHQTPVSETFAEFFSHDFDTVLVCSENARHLRDTLAAAENKKHVIVEKPMALTLGEADQIIQATTDSGVKLMVCHPVRFTETIQQLKQNIEAGNLGEVYGINATNHGKNPGGWFVDKSLSGGGALIDHTIHISDLLNWLFDVKVASMTAYAATAIADIPVEDSGLIHGTFTNGSVFSIDTSWNRPENYPVWGDAILEIVSSKGHTSVDGFGRRATVYNQQAEVGQWDFYEENMDMAMIKEFVRTVKEDLPSPVDGYAGRYTIEMFNMAYEAVKRDENNE